MALLMLLVPGAGAQKATANSNTETVQQKRVPCGGELLHNGICLDKYWPPRKNFSSSTQQGLIVPPLPAYLVDPPAVRNITVGRQLFVDKFLGDASRSMGVTQTFFAAEYLDNLNPVITFE